MTGHASGAGVFHDFHLTWNVEIKKALNDGVLPLDHTATRLEAKRTLIGRMRVARRLTLAGPPLAPPPGYITALGVLNTATA